MTRGFIDYGGHNTICAQCGYRFVKGDDALKLRQTGDIIHRDCLMDYTEDNLDELTEEIDF